MASEIEEAMKSFYPIYLGTAGLGVNSFIKKG